VTYDETVQALQTLCVVPLNNSDENFMRILPRTFEYAENRMYRELDMLPTTVAVATTTLSGGNPRVTVPTQLLNTRYVNLISPVGTSGDAGTRTPLERISPEMMDLCFPTTGTSGTSLPAKYALYGTTGGSACSSSGAMTMRVGPGPVTSYGLEFIGPVRPEVLSKTNPTTILTMRFPDMYIAACMVYLMGYQRDFVAQSSDPSAAMSWEKTYTSLREGAIVEIQRQKSESVGWSAQTPSVLANQPRDRVPLAGG